MLQDRFLIVWSPFMTDTAIPYFVSLTGTFKACRIG